MNLRHHRQIEELAELLDGQRAPEDASASTRSLAAVATTVMERDPLPAVELGEDRKAALRAQLLVRIAELPNTEPATAPDSPLREKARRAARSAKVGLASGLASAMVGTTGVALAAQEALPGDALYGVKKVTENVRLSLAGDEIQSARLQLRFAEERLEEITLGRERVSSADLIESLSEMDRRSLQGADELLRIAERDERAELVTEVADFTQRQVAGLAEIFSELPIDVRPHAEDSFSVLRRIRVELLFPVLERCDSCTQIAGAAGALTETPAVLARLRQAGLPTFGFDADSEVPPAQTRTAGDAGAVPTPSTEPDDAVSGTGSGLRSSGGALTDVVDTTTDTVDRVVEDTTGTVGKVVEDTTGTVGKVVEDTTGTVRDAVTDPGGTVGKVVEDTTGTVGKVVEDTTGTVGKVVQDTTSTLDGLLGGR